jgi:hypothetical protein
MPRLLFSFLTIIFSVIFCNSIAAKMDDRDPNMMRQQLIVALKNSKVTDSLYNELNNTQHKSALMLGYLGTVQALKAVHAWNPFTKIKYLNAAEKTYKSAVDADPHNIEIRFMRFSVEHHVPGFLGYNKNLDTDRKAIIAQLKKGNYHSNDKVFIKTVVQFLLDSKRCTTDENSYLNKQLQQLA